MSESVLLENNTDLLLKFKLYERDIFISDN